MSNVLLIGNGFDIYHRLPTRYSDFLFLVRRWPAFYKNFCEKFTVLNSNQKVDVFDVRVDEKGKLTVDALMDYINHANSLDYDKIQKLDTIISENVWIKYFTEIQYEKDGWIDFEKEIEIVLENIEKFFSEEIYKNNTFFSTGLDPICSKVISLLMKISTSLRDIRPQKAAADIFPNYFGLRRIASKSFINTVVYGDYKRKLLDELFIALNGLIEALQIYFSEFVEKIHIEYYSKQIKNLDVSYLLNFNYTNTYNFIYSQLSSSDQHHIHGPLEKEKMVLGISDDRFDSLDYVYFQKYFQRIQKRTGSFYRNWIPTPKNSIMLSDPIDLYIMGHSLGMTDKSILREFFENDISVRKIYIYYHSQDSYEELVISLIDMFGKSFVIEETGKQRIYFVKLEDAISST